MTAMQQRLIRLKPTIDRTGRSRTRIYADIEAGTFPRPVKIGGRCIAFVESEIDEWIAARMTARDEVA
jgi:prophage regulatory protein